MRKLVIAVDKQLCAGNRMCLHHASEVFRLDANGKSEVRNPTGDSEDRVVAAAYACPSGAISVHDEETGADVLDEPFE
jgi:ferredoxin